MITNKRDLVATREEAQGQPTIVAAATVKSVKNQTHRAAVEEAHEQGITHFYRHCGRLYRCNRLGKEWIIIDHLTGAYCVSDRLKAGMVNMSTNDVWVVLGILIKHKQIMRGFMECCLLSFHMRSSSRGTLIEMKRELLKVFGNGQ